MRTDIPPQRDRGISKRAYHRKLVAFDAPKAPKWTKPKRSTRQRKRSKWMAGTTRWRRVETEEMFGLDVLAYRTHRKPPQWRLTKVAESGEVYYYALRKFKRLSNMFPCTQTPSWELAGPEGFEGVHTYHNTKMGAIRLCADLDESKFDKEEAE